LEQLAISGKIVRGPTGMLYLAIAKPPDDVCAIRVRRVIFDLFVPNPPNGFAIYHQPVTNGYVDVPIEMITNGVYRLPDAEFPPFAVYILRIQGVDVAGRVGPMVTAWWASQVPTGTGYQSLHKYLH
jgi:hypothetical protein